MAGKLEMITPDGRIGATASVAAPSAQLCTQGLPAVLQPPVSASAGEVFFRDGDTHIRFLAPDGRTGDATTVPGNSTTVSFFSVSPDDQLIAVLVEDLAPDFSINLRLYVEDLHGGGHHADIYSTSTRKGETGTTLWPMGWHDGLLVLALVAPCAFNTEGLAPTAYHVVDPATADRHASIGRQGCAASWWPSSAGVACIDIGFTGATVYDWTGKVTGNVVTAADEGQSGLSPSGQSIFFTGGSRWTNVLGTADGTASSARSAARHVDGHGACLWIDEHHLLAPDAVLTTPAGSVTSLPAGGVCAGRFPGGL